MFKKIPGTAEYRINLKYDVVDLLGEKAVLKPSKLGEVKIALFGVEKIVTLKWLSLLAWYECGVINDLKDHLDKIRFFPIDRRIKVRCGYVMQFTEPIYYCQDFRYIPTYPRYAINTTGTVIDTVENHYVDEECMQHGYSTQYIYSPDRSVNKHIRVHRLLALAWLPNNDFLNSPIINHVDSIRDNNALVNLEWCSFSENSIHAVSTGRVKTIKMKTRDVHTGEVRIFESVAELSKKLGFSRGYSSVSFTDRLPGFLYKQRYEVKELDDDSPWYYEDNAYDQDEPKKQYFLITVLNKETGVKTVFTNVRKFYKAFKLYSSPNLDTAIAWFRERYAGYDISYTSNAVKGPYQVIDIENNKITIMTSIRKVAAHIDRNNNEVNIDLRRGNKFIYSKKWIVMPGMNKVDISQYLDKPNPCTGILVVDSKHKTETEVKSIKEATRLTGVVGRTINKCLASGKAVKGLCFRPLDQ